MTREFDIQAVTDSARGNPGGMAGDLLAVGLIENGRLVVPEEAYIEIRHRHRVRPPRGLGDRIATVAQPIAKAIDWLLGTDIENCQGCKDRRAWLNHHFPGGVAAHGPPTPGK